MRRKWMDDEKSAQPQMLNYSWKPRELVLLKLALHSLLYHFIMSSDTERYHPKWGCMAFWQLILSFLSEKLRDTIHFKT